MGFSIYLPHNPTNRPLASILFLGGMTCSDESFFQQAGAIRRASELGLALICPDTSPRNTGIDGEDGCYDLGSGASFYVDATEPKWAKHYNMYSYITHEFRDLIFKEFPLDSKRMSVSGHSMGGNGALFIALRNTGMFVSCSAFAPVCNPSKNKWGRKVFTEYLGSDESSWKPYDAVEVLRALKGNLSIPVLIDQGGQDFFDLLNEDALTPYRLVELVSKASPQPLTFNLREGYDHFFYFIQTFIDSHLNFHAQHLGII
ncbi:hypothetical protein DSO57_1018435 [Entomophthora muscae]|uniref:Uncharacterized protein n=1 Tax=Entomophthora muscae TaxID=34485 RepID=A0ACC2UD59_9FUNG|nr:hypothetical protein DSO57_1018435 [Entomophthora muscae]